jgi:hypothetical protein
MRATCPDCGATGHVSAFFADDDGKRLLAAVVDLPAELQRPVLGYLGLFKPGKNALSMPRATRLVQELQQLVATGTVSRDDRTGVRRQATPTMWSEGIEQMLANRSGLTLPLPSHNYLRAVVFGIADQTDARAERAQEQQRQAGQHHVDWLRQQHSYGASTREELDHAIAEARARYGIDTDETNS